MVAGSTCRTRRRGCTPPRYAWLNAVQAAGKGKLTMAADGGRIDYEFVEIR